jgi:hypothetical protein
MPPVDKMRLLSANADALAHPKQSRDGELRDAPLRAPLQRQLRRSRDARRQDGMLVSELSDIEKHQ